MDKNTKVLLIDNKISGGDLLNPFRGTVKVKVTPSVKDYDVVAVYDAPVFLPFWFREIKNVGFHFKYHIAIYFDPLGLFKSYDLLASHVGLLLMSKNFKPNKVRIPHQYCHFCGKTLKDWGGKTHLMHPEGFLISDVWKDLPLTYRSIVGRNIPENVVERVKQMFGEIEVIESKKEVIRNDNISENCKIESLPNRYVNSVIQGDVVERLKDIPSNCIDTVFIDPPYNLGKKYLNYEDERKDYVEWSKKWIEECFRILKPTGNLFLLNIPKWAHEIAVELLPDYYLVRWIVWDEPAEPRGKLIPSHYSLLWLSKQKEIKSYDVGISQDSMNYCLRAKCVKIRRSLGVNDKVEVRDLRWDIHRLKHRHKRFKFHPVQLPKRLLEFVISLTTKEGDIVLDPMCGTGTTLVVAKEMGRKYVGIDIDPTYIEITNKRLSGQLTEILETKANNIKSAYHRLTKKWIQIKMGELAEKINRIPTINDASNYLNVKEEVLCRFFPNWSKALKLAKIVLEHPNSAINASQPITIDKFWKKGS